MYAAARAMRLLAAQPRHEGMHRLETSDILAGGEGPGALGDRREMREDKAIEAPPVIEPLAPKASLHSEQSSLHVVWPVTPRVIRIAALQWEAASRARPGIPPIGGLRHVEVV